MENWLTRFQKMMEELQEHPQVELLTFHTFSPIEKSQFEIFEEKYKISFTDSLKSFYSQTNGLQLRWIFKNNENFSEEKYQFSEEVLEWDYFQKTFRFEDGGVMLLPMEKMLEGKMFDAFSEIHNMAFTENDFVLKLCEEENLPVDSPTTDIESYLEFLIAGKGLISRRAFFYHLPNGQFGKRFNSRNLHFQTPKSFWREEKILHLDQALLKDIFPLADQVSFFENKINRIWLRQMAENGEQISQTKLEKIIENHHEFLMSGGAGGSWTVLEIKGFVTGIYDIENQKTEGEQAVFERKNLSKNNFRKVELPYSNFCAAFAEGVNFSNSNFSKLPTGQAGSLFTDAFLKGANFSNSIFTNTDFSRADLQNANFQNADLRNADFENCNLTGANFQGAKLEGARFPGTILKDILF